MLSTILFLFFWILQNTNRAIIQGTGGQEEGDGVVKVKPWQAVLFIVCGVAAAALVVWWLRKGDKKEKEKWKEINNMPVEEIVYTTEAEQAEHDRKAREGKQ